MCWGAEGGEQDRVHQEILGLGCLCYNKGSWNFGLLKVPSG